MIFFLQKISEEILNTALSLSKISLLLYFNCLKIPNSSFNVICISNHEMSNVRGTVAPFLAQQCCQSCDCDIIVWQMQHLFIFLLWVPVHSMTSLPKRGQGNLLGVQCISLLIQMALHLFSVIPAKRNELFYFISFQNK